MNQFFVYLSLHLNEFRENLAVPGTLLLLSAKSAYCWCSTIGTPHRRNAGCTVPVGDQSTLFPIIPLIFVPFVQYAG
jgi:hypothetical protein